VEIAGDFYFLADQDIDTAPEDDLGLDLGSQQTCDFFGKDRSTLGAEGLEAVKVQNEGPMP